MMMETLHDPYDILFGDEQQSLPSEGLMFSNEIMFSDYHTDSSSISPIQNTIEYTENDFDAAIFEDLVNQLFSSDPSLLKEQSMELPFSSIETEPLTREMGTDPMESIQPSLIDSTNMNQLATNSILLIQTTNQQTVPGEYFNFQLTTNDYPIEDSLPLTPSSSSESHDETNSNSPDNIYPTMLTDLDNLPTSGSLRLTNEEIRIIKQEGYQVPTKLPLNKTEEKILKKVRRKIKNKISAQESRRKKKEYVDALEKQMAKYISENTVLKERMTVIEKNQKSLTQERDLLRSLIGKVTTTATTNPAPSTALMVFAVFFAVLFGVWSPVTNRTSIDDKSLSFISAHNYQSEVPTHKSLLDQQETLHSNNHKSRVLLSIDEYDNHHHGPYLPSNNKYQSKFPQQTAAPGYTYSNTVEKYMNKKISNEQLKRSFNDESPEEITYKKFRSNYHIIEETTNEMENDLNESKPVKIIRVERTIPSIGNDTLKISSSYDK